MHHRVIPGLPGVPVPSHPIPSPPLPQFGGDGKQVTVMGYASGSHIAALALIDGLPTATATATATASSVARPPNATTATKATPSGAVTAECVSMSWATTYRLAALMLDVLFFGECVRVFTPSPPSKSPY